MLKMTVETVDHRGEWDAMRIRTETLNGWQTLVGIFEGAANDKSKGTPIAEYMGYQETGTKNKDGTVRVKPSPWMTTMVDARTEHYQERLAKAEQDVLFGRTTAEQALNSIAMELAGDLVRSITIFGLVDTGAARQNIRFRTFRDKVSGSSKSGNAGDIGDDNFSSIISEFE